MSILYKYYEEMRHSLNQIMMKDTESVSRTLVSRYNFTYFFGRREFVLYIISKSASITFLRFCLCHIILNAECICGMLD